MIKKLIIDKAERLQKLPPSPLLEAERIRKALHKRGVEIIDLGELSPDASIRETVHSFLSLETQEIFAPVDPRLWGNLKKEIADWVEQKYQVKLNPENEILPFAAFSHTVQGAGRRKIIYDLFLSFLNPGEVAAIPDPSDPVYKGGCIFAGGQVVSLPLWERTDYLPNLSTLPSSKDTANFPKVLFLNYPHDPTTAVADPEFFRELVQWAHRKNILLLNDASYNEICHDGYVPTSLLQAKGIKKIGAELFFFYPLTGIGFGFLAGNRQIISQVEATERAFGYGASQMTAHLGLAVLKNYSAIAERNNTEFYKRREILMQGLSSLGWKAKRPKAGPFIWTKVPPRYSSVGFARMLLRKAGVLVSPGFGFGEHGERYVRISLNHQANELNKALARLKEHSHVWQRRYRPAKTNP